MAKSKERSQIKTCRTKKKDIKHFKEAMTTRKKDISRPKDNEKQPQVERQQRSRKRNSWRKRK